MYRQLTVLNRYFDAPAHSEAPASTALQGADRRLDMVKIDAAQRLVLAQRLPNLPAQRRLRSLRQFVGDDLRGACNGRIEARENRAQRRQCVAHRVSP
jgi:hypothetical protein